LEVTENTMDLPHRTRDSCAAESFLNPVFWIVFAVH
jgi:hypothetical protein